jgi:cytochrome P450
MTDSTSIDTGDVDLYASFEEFNAAMGGGVQDPHQMLADIRADSPLLVGGFADMMAVLGTGLTDGDTDLAALIGDDLTGAVALSYDLVQEVLRDGETYSSALYALFMGPLMGHSILEMDEPEHHRYRALIQKAFTRTAMERWEAELVKPICDRLIDDFAERGSADLAREYTFWFPINVIAGLLGLPAADLPRFHRLAVELISGPFMPERGQQASSELRTYFATILDARRLEPADDLISDLAQVELEGEQLTDEEIFSFLRLLLPAGAETTYRSSGNLLYGLLTNPEQLEAVRADRTLIPRAIEEGIRWEPPLTAIVRTATRSVELAGTSLPSGSVVVAHLGAANRDPSRWEDPDRFDIFRDPKPHTSFALGPHTCLGMHLARMETRVALETLLDRLADLRLDTAGQDAHITGLGFRSPTSLPVQFTST